MDDYDKGDPRQRFDEWTMPEVKDGELTEYNWVVNSPDGLALSEYVDIGAFTIINAHEGVEIQEGVQIGPHCDIHSHSTIDGKKGKVNVQEGARIGSHSTILPGVEIGKNALVAAHSLVNRDVEEGEFVRGVPIK